MSFYLSNAIRLDKPVQEMIEIFVSTGILLSLWKIERARRYKTEVTVAPKKIIISKSIQNV